MEVIKGDPSEVTTIIFYKSLSRSKELSIMLTSDKSHPLGTSLSDMFQDVFPEPTGGRYVITNQQLEEYLKRLIGSVHSKFRVA